MSSELFVLVSGAHILMNYLEEIERLRRQTMETLQNILQELKRGLNDVHEVSPEYNTTALENRLKTLSQSIEAVRNATPLAIIQSLQQLTRDIEAFRRDLQRALCDAMLFRFEVLAKTIEASQELEPEDRAILLERIALYRKAGEGGFLRKEVFVEVFQTLERDYEKARKRYQELLTQKRALLAETTDLIADIEKHLELLLPKDQALVKTHLEALKTPKQTKSLAEEISLLSDTKTVLLKLKNDITEAAKRTELHHVVVDLSGDLVTPKAKPKENDLLLERIQALRDLVKQNSQGELAEKVDKLCEGLETASPTRREAVYGQLVFLYQEMLRKREERLHLETRLKELETVITSLPSKRQSELLKRLQTIRASQEVREEDIRSLEREVQNLLYEETTTHEILALEQRKAVFQLVRKTLESEGYTVTGNFLWNAKPMYLRTPWNRYRLKVTANSRGEILLQFVRIVASQEEAQRRSATEKAQDREIAKQWCQQWNRIAARLQELGVRVTECWRKEPEEYDVAVEVHPEMLAEELRKEDFQEGRRKQERKL